MPVVTKHRWDTIQYINYSQFLMVIIHTHIVIKGSGNMPMRSNIIS
jgi:hypothetical protein